jgi:hypothetical protein
MFGGDVSASYVVPDDANCRYYFIDLNAFWTGSGALDLTECPMFLVARWIRRKDCTLAPAFEGSYWEIRQWKNLDRILYIFLF